MMTTMIDQNELLDVLATAVQRLEEKIDSTQSAVTRIDDMYSNQMEGVRKMTSSFHDIMKTV